jgi:hypothetical protein
MKFRHFLLVLAVWLITWSLTMAAQSPQSRLMGVVTDGSGGALPGVTVTLRGAGVPPTPVVTDEAGRYLSAWVPAGVYVIDFGLSGFESKTVTNVPLGAGQTVVLDQQLAVAAMKETVEVTAAAPPPEPPPAPPRAPRPTAKPVDRQILASVCGPRQATEFSQAIGRIVSHRDDPNRQLIGPGDLLQIDAGENQGVVNGQNLVVRRKFQTGDRLAPKKLATYAEQSAGLVQVVETQADAAIALVVYVCGELSAGDTVEPYLPQPAFFAVSSGTPHFDAPARITTGESGATAASAGQMMVIDRGIMQGAQRGQRVTIFRRTQGIDAIPLTIGDGLIVAIRADSATIRIERATDAVVVGDLVALHR